MNKIRSSYKAGIIAAKKTLAVILIGAFLFTDISAWAGGNTNLSPELRTSASGFKELYKAVAICRSIEKDGELGDVSSISDILTRLRNVKSQFESIHFLITTNEVVIEVPDEGLAIRYFDPAEANTITSYSDISKLETKVISSKLSRQIIHRIKALPSKNVTSESASGLKKIKINGKTREVDIQIPAGI